MLTAFMPSAPLPLHALRLARGISSSGWISRSMATSVSVRQAKPVAADPPAHLPGCPSSRFLSDMEQCWVDPAKPAVSLGGTISTFRLTNIKGQLLPHVSEQSLELEQSEAREIYKLMLFLPTLDDILYNAQRQGRISFMMTSHGEEAAVIGAASGLDPADEVFSQYRENGVLLWRGFSPANYMSQMFGAYDDQCGGRQMPMHFGSREHHFHTVSSPLATQIPQAAGAAFALKSTPGREGNVAACFLGEGAASEGDAHAGFNIASTTKCPVLFIVRNNGYAISTPSTQQYAGDGLASRGAGYGMPALRVDGNDVLAVRAAIKAARNISLTRHVPTLIELMTYRVGHHSTSDDSSAYRPKSSVNDWKRLDNPLDRMRQFLVQRGWWTESEDAALKKQYRTQVIQEMTQAEKKPLPALSSLFEGTYDTVPPNLVQQRSELARLVAKYAQFPTWAKELKKYKDNGKDLAQYYVPRL